MSPHQDSSQRNRISASAGFTLVEVLVSLALLTTGLVPAFVLASNAVNLSTQIKNSLISANLAQEGVEVVRAIRDSNWFADSLTPLEDNGLSSCAGGCQVQWDSVDMDNTSKDSPLKLDPKSGMYQYNGSGPDSIFRRKITITTVTPGVEIAVISEVEWTERTSAKKVVIEYHLFNWLP